MYRNYRYNNHPPYKHPAKQLANQPFEQPFQPEEQSFSQCHHEQKHVHEIQGSVVIAEPQEYPHNHRFATVSDEAIPLGPNDHYHEVKFRTDFYENHFHEFCGRTTGAIPVGDRHVHFIKSVTSVNDGHQHNFRVATLIDNPVGDSCK